MALINIHTWNEHVSVGEAVVGTVYLLHNHNLFPQVLFHEVNPEVFPDRWQSLTLIDWAH